MAKILVVDDQPMVLKCLKSALTADGHGVIAQTRSVNISDGGALLSLPADAAPESGADVLLRFAVPRATPNTYMLEEFVCHGQEDISPCKTVTVSAWPCGSSGRFRWPWKSSRRTPPTERPASPMGSPSRRCRGGSRRPASESCPPPGRRVAAPR